MENFGIDIGNHKTVLTGSTRNGRILVDNLDKRATITQFSISENQREFGNNATYRKNTKIYRHFQNDQAALTMYFCYLHRMIKANMDKNTKLGINFAPNVTLTTKHFNIKDISDMLMCVKAANMNVSSVFHDITCAAANLCLKIKAHKEFMVVDLGHSQSTLGHFTFVDGILKTKKIKSLDIGGGIFDEKLFFYILDQCGLEKEPASDVSNMSGYTVGKTIFRPSVFKESHKFLSLKETVIPKLKKYKMIISQSARVEDTLEFGDDLYKVIIEQSDYKEMIGEEIEKIKNFIISNLKSLGTKEDIPVEIVGGNSNNFFIKEMLQSLPFNTMQSCDSHESVCFGAAIAGALPFYTTKVKVMDILVGDVLLNGEVIFKDGDSVDKEVFVDVDGEELIWKLNGEKNNCKIVEENEDEGKKNKSDEEAKNNEEAKKDEVETVQSTNENGITDGEGFKRCPRAKTLTFTHQNVVIFEEEVNAPFTAIFTKSKVIRIKDQSFEEDVSHLLRREEEFRKKELEMEEIGNLTNDFQVFLERLQGIVGLPIFYTLFTELEVEEIGGLSLEFMYLPVSDKLVDEKKKIEEYSKKIEKYVGRMQELVDSKKKAALSRIELTMKNLEKVKIYTPSVYKLQSKLNGQKSLIEGCAFDGNVDVLNLEVLDGEIVRLELKIEKEVKDKEREKIEREERERKAKEELEKSRKRKEVEQEKAIEKENNNKPEESENNNKPEESENNDEVSKKEKIEDASADEKVIENEVKENNFEKEVAKTE